MLRYFEPILRLFFTGFDYGMDVGKGPKHDDLISQFTNMTGCDADQATFYLESTNWEIGAAIETYFDAGAGGAEDADMASIPPENVASMEQRVGQHVAAQSASFAAGPPPPRVVSGSAGAVAPPPAANRSVNPPSSSARIATFNSIRNRESDDDSDHERDRDDEQEFYVGSGGNQSINQSIGYTTNILYRGSIRYVHRYFYFVQLSIEFS